ncbi:hypothetical protein EVAR_41838_1 [Eumeta japonica]|uniref:Uncharacterized protein n=1 Tax=Eumeta variegata TaxID=151549 RepID=A0A4C1X8L2_EUMVA|nr:hypothetical protein EVAR_41838_1 [Eumeta japonica]
MANIVVNTHETYKREVRFYYNLFVTKRLNSPNALARRATWQHRGAPAARSFAFESRTASREVPSANPAQGTRKISTDSRIAPRPPRFRPRAPLGVDVVPRPVPAFDFNPNSDRDYDHPLHRRYFQLYGSSHDAASVCAGVTVTCATSAPTEYNTSVPHVDIFLILYDQVPRMSRRRATVSPRRDERAGAFPRT